MATKKRRPGDDPREPTLFELPPPVVPEPLVGELKHPVWTENKARLIERYLYYFVLITKHGTYIDGFAGPQGEDGDTDLWSARLVLESEPRWLRNFFLFDLNPKQVGRIQAMVDAQPPRDKKRKEPKRLIEVEQGDFNAKVVELLASGKVKASEATFCLLDQRTFECKWSTVEALAQHKGTGNKIELFYFLPVHWLDRALSGVKNESITRDWWGGDPAMLKAMDRQQRVHAFTARLKNDLGYKSVKPWPIFQRQDGGNIMYFMIHATDHPEAPGLMKRAYNKAVTPKEPVEQLMMEPLFVGAATATTKPDESA